MDVNGPCTIKSRSVENLCVGSRAVPIRHEGRGSIEWMQLKMFKKKHVSILGFPVCRTCVDHVCVAVLEKWYILGPHHQMSLPYKTVSQIMIGVDLLQNGYHLGTYPWPPSSNWVNNYLLQNGTVIFYSSYDGCQKRPWYKKVGCKVFFSIKMVVQKAFAQGPRPSFLHR